MKKFREVIWGICFIAVGFVLCLNVLGVTDIDIFFSGWWTLFIIVPCFIGLFTENFLGNLFGFLLGMALLCACQGWIHFGTIFRLIFPIALVFVGIHILFREKIQGKVTEKWKELQSTDGKSIVAIFGGQNVRVDDEYVGGEVEAIFGSVDLDLRSAKLKEETAMKISAIFGGVTLIVPENVNVVLKSTPVFGGVESKVHNGEKAKKTIYIEAVAVFGGVEIK